MSKKQFSNNSTFFIIFSNAVDTFFDQLNMLENKNPFPLFPQQSSFNLNMAYKLQKME